MLRIGEQVVVRGEWVVVEDIDAKPENTTYIGMDKDGGRVDFTIDSVDHVYDDVD